MDTVDCTDNTRSWWKRGKPDRRVKSKCSAPRHFDGWKYKSRRRMPHEFEVNKLNGFEDKQEDAINHKLQKQEQEEVSNEIEQNQDINSQDNNNHMEVIPSVSAYGFEHREDMINDVVLPEVCLSYTVKGYDTCTPLNSLFLPLCQNNDTDYNVSALSVDDLTGIITQTSDGVNANGAEVYDALGIEVEFKDFDRHSEEFKVCMANVSVEVDYQWGDTDRIDVANWVVFGMDRHHEGCTNNDGLPCLS